MILAAGTNSGPYKFLLVLHILTVVVGIGAVFLNALYGGEARQRPGAPGRAITEANLAVSIVARYVIYGILATGILLVVLSDDSWSFGDTWIWLSIALYVIALGISHGVLTPSVERIIALRSEMEQGPPPAGGPPPQLAEMQGLGQRLKLGGLTTNALTTAIIFLMVWKPGS